MHQDDSRPGTGAAGPSDAGAAFGFPLFLEVRGRRVFVAGGGRLAATKAAALVDLGAHVRLWAPAHDATRLLATSPSIDMRTGPFAPALLDAAVLAIAATGLRAIDEVIAREARGRGILVNVPDVPALSDWSAPAVLRRGGLTVAVATGGVAPALAVRIRDRLADDLGPEYGELLALLAPIRRSILAADRSLAERRAVWRALVDGPALGHLRERRPDAARRALEEALEMWLVSS